MSEIELITAAGLFGLVMAVGVQVALTFAKTESPRETDVVLRIRTRGSWKLFQRVVVILVFTASTALFVLSFTHSETRTFDWVMVTTVWSAMVAVVLWPYGDRLDVFITREGIQVHSILIRWEDIQRVSDDGATLLIHTRRRYWNTWHGKVSLPRYVWDIEVTTREIEKLKSEFLPRER